MNLRSIGRYMLRLELTCGGSLEHGMIDVLMHRLTD
jgi:hypothetical protein